MLVRESISSSDCTGLLNPTTQTECMKIMNLRDRKSPWHGEIMRRIHNQQLLRNVLQARSYRGGGVNRLDKIFSPIYLLLRNAQFRYMMTFPVHGGSPGLFSMHTLFLRCTWGN